MRARAIVRILIRIVHVVQALEFPPFSSLPILESFDT